MKKWLVPFLLAAGLLGGCASATQQVDARVGKNFVFSTGVGREFTITLAANPSTGYDWRREYDPSMLNLAGLAFEPAAGAALRSNGTMTLRFKALKAGDTILTLRYSRGLEVQASDQKVLAVSIY